MKLKSLLILLLAVCLRPVLADTQPPETSDDVQAAKWELSKFADAHGCDFWEGDKIDGKWTVDIVRLSGKTGKTTWKEVGYNRAMPAVDSLEKDFEKHPEGYEGHAPEGDR